MSWTFVVLALVLFLFAIYIGFLCGQWACEKRVITKRDYWIAFLSGPITSPSSSFSLLIVEGQVSRHCFGICCSP